MEARNDNVYIADLPEVIDEEIVKSVFGAYGAIASCKAMPGKVPGQKGAALVRFATVDEAAWVVENLNGNIPQGFEAPVVVRFANNKSKGGGKGMEGGQAVGGYGKAPAAAAWSPLGPYNGKGAGKGKGGCDIRTLLDGLFKSGAMPGGQKGDDRCLYITGLPSDTTDMDMYKMFSPFGALCQRGVKAMLHEDGSCRGFGFVDYIDANSMQAAILTLNGTVMPDGSTLQVRPKGPSKTKMAAQG